MSLLDKFAEMQSEAQSQELNKVAELEQHEQETYIAKYASWAEDTLNQEIGEGNFTAEDVEKLATAKMEDDAYEFEMREKVAEAYELGAIMYEGFKAAAASDAAEEN
jgi:hypothetical protein